MKKAEVLKRYRIDKLDDCTVFISNREFNFSYTSVKPEYKDNHRYFGGLQCNYEENTIEYKNLENWLCEIAENTLK